MKPLVSVIIPSLNEENYIEKSLKSVKAQDYKNDIEIIVADSNSKDNTAKIARKYAKVIVTKRKGISVGRNVGAKKARGEILLFLDADTILMPNVVSEVVRYLEENK